MLGQQNILYDIIEVSNDTLKNDLVFSIVLIVFSILISSFMLYSLRSYKKMLLYKIYIVGLLIGILAITTSVIVDYIHTKSETNNFRTMLVDNDFEIVEGEVTDIIIGTESKINSFTIDNATFEINDTVNEMLIFESDFLKIGIQLIILFKNGTILRITNN